MLLERMHTFLGENVDSKRYDALMSKDGSLYNLPLLQDTFPNDTFSLFPYPERKMEKLSYAVDNTGNAYIVAQVSGENNENQLEVLRYAIGSADLRSVKVPVAKTMTINNFKLYEADNREIIGGGFYINDGFKKGIDGVVLARFTADGVLAWVKSYEAPLEINNYYKPGLTKRADGGEPRR